MCEHKRKNPFVSAWFCRFTADLSSAQCRQRPHASRMRPKPQEARAGEVMSGEGESINMFQEVKLRVHRGVQWFSQTSMLDRRNLRTAKQPVRELQSLCQQLLN